MSRCTAHLLVRGSHGTVSHQALVDLVISNKASRHAEERNGEVPAFMIGNTCFAWWSRNQLRRLADRKQREKRTQEEQWPGVKGPAGLCHLLTTPPEPPL